MTDSLGWQAWVKSVPLANRSRRQFWRDTAGGLLLGWAVAVMFSAWVLLVNTHTNGGIEIRYGVGISSIVAVYFGGLGVAGATAGALRPWLGTAWGRLATCWVAAFALYGGVQLIMPPLFGNPIVGGLVIATIATPIWFVVLRVGFDKQLRAVAGLPPRQRRDAKPLPEQWAVYRSTPDGRRIRVRTCRGKEAGEREAERLRSLGLEHEYWTEKA